MGQGKNDFIAKLMEGNRYGAVYILARYFYRVGEPILSDAVYEKLEKVLSEKCRNEMQEYLTRIYDDDPIPEDLLAEIGVKPVYFVKNENRKELYDYLNEDKSFSIRSVTNYEEAFEFFKVLKNEHLDFVASIKVDGVNTKMLYLDSEFSLSLSRGRNGDSFDYTDNSAKVMPQRIACNTDVLKIVGESYVIDEGLEVLRKKYGKPAGYVSGKSSAISMLRVEHDREDYKLLRTMVFCAEGLNDSLSETLEKLKQEGVDVVPHKLVRWQEIPDGFSNFEVWLKKDVLDYLWEKGKGIPSDGVVIEVNDLKWLGVQKDQYVSRQLALKFDHWGYACYEGIIKSIRIEQRRVNKSVRIEIEPVKTRDGNNATVINSFNPSIIIENDLYIGKKVFFERNSDAANVLIYGDRLTKIMDEVTEDV